MAFRKRLFCIFAVLLALIPAFFTFCGFTVSADARLKHSGKGSVRLTFVTDDEEDVFRAYMKREMEGFNVLSGDSDMVTVRSMEKTDEGYTADIEFRRIDKLKIRGEFELGKLSSYVADGGMGHTNLENFDKGNLRCTVSSYYDGVLGQIIVPRSSVLPVSPYDCLGSKLKINDFLEYGKTAKDNVTIFMFKMFDMPDVVRAEMTFPGKITYYGGENIELISSDTAVITPAKLEASILKNKTVIGDDGTERLESEITEKEIGAFVGYIVFEKTMSPFVVAIIIIACILFVGIVIACIVAFKLYGRKLLKKEAKTRG